MLMFTNAFNDHSWLIFVIPATLLILHVLDKKGIL